MLRRSSVTSHVADAVDEDRPPVGSMKRLIIFRLVFAAAGRPDEDADLPRRHLEREVVDGGGRAGRPLPGGAVDLRDVLELDGGGAASEGGGGGGGHGGAILGHVPGTVRQLRATAGRRPDLLPIRPRSAAGPGRRPAPDPGPGPDRYDSQAWVAARACLRAVGGALAGLPSYRRPQDRRPRPFDARPHTLHVYRLRPPTAAELPASAVLRRIPRGPPVAATPRRRVASPRR